MAVLDELLVELGFEYDPEDLESFQSDLDKTTGLVKKLASTLVAGTAALFGFAAATTSASDEQGKLADEVGIAVETLDALQFASKRTGGSAEGLSSSLQQLSVRIGETARGVGSGIEAFGILGISVNKANGELKTTDEVLLEVSDKFQDLSKAQQIELAEKLGLRDSIRLLQQGSAGIQDLVKEAQMLGVTTEEDSKIAAQFQDSLTDMWQIIKQISRTIAKSLVPFLEDTNESFAEWWKTNRAVIEQRMPEFIEKAAKAIKLLTAAAIGFIAVKLISTLLTLLTLMKGLTLSTLAFNAAVMALPILIATVIAAIGLLAEDAMVFFEGGESFIGSMIEKYPQWADEIRAIAAIFATLGELTGMVFEGWGMIFDLFSDPNFGRDLKMVFEQLWFDFKKMIDNMLDSVSNFFSEMWQDFKDMISNMLDEITSFFSSMADKATGAFHTITFGAFEEDEPEVPEGGTIPITTMISAVRTVTPVFQELTKDISIEDIEATIGFDIPELPDFGLEDLVQKIGFDVDSEGVMQNHPEDMVREINVEEITSNKMINGFSSAANDSDMRDMQSGSSFIPNDVSTTSNSDNSTTFQGGVTINIDGSQSPEETARVVRQELNDLAEQTSTDLNSAVRL